MPTHEIVTHSGYHRPTRFEVHVIAQKADGWLLTCSDRNAAPLVPVDGKPPQAVRLPELFVVATQFSQEENDAITRAFALLERGAAEAFDAHAADHKERLKDHVGRLLDAQRQAEEAELALEAQKAAHAAELARLDLELEQRRAALAALGEGS